MTALAIDEITRLERLIRAHKHDGFDSRAVAGGAGAFTALSDAPASYAGAADYLVAVNADGDGLEFREAEGAPGADGATWHRGSGAPAGALGAVGDLYLRTDTGDVYEKTGASTWTQVANLTGPTGAAGAAGPAGATGDTGPQGDQGEQGETGPAGADGADGADGAGITAGIIMAWPTGSAPTGWLLCDGTAVSRATYSDLFAVISTTFGAGDGSTTFNVPNIMGRVVVGVDAGQTEFDTIGETGGAKTHTLVEGEMPSHTHVQNAHTHTQNPHQHGMAEGTTDGSGTFADRSNAAAAAAMVTDNATATNQNATATNQTTGGGGAHNNLQPYMALNWIIRT